MEQTESQATGASSSATEPAAPASVPVPARSGAAVPATRHRRSIRTRNGLTPEQRRQQRHQALLDAGLELFGTKGYTSTSVEEICRTAFVSTRNFYEEFENRESLLWTLVYQFLADGYSALRNDPEALSLPDELRARVGGMVHAFLDDPRRARLVFVECRGMSLIQEYRRRAAQQAFAQLLNEILERRGARPAVSERALPTFALAMVGAVDLVLSDWVLQEERPPIDDLIESLVEVINFMGSSGRRVRPSALASALETSAFRSEPSALLVDTNDANS